MLLSIILIYFSGYWIIYSYQAVLIIIVEILNRQKNYILKNGKYWNWFYLLYLVFITLERGKWLVFKGIASDLINILEHMFFALLVCSQLYFLLELIKFFQNKNIYKLVAVFILFNIIGIVNELYQNVLSNLELFEMVYDSWKDLQVNFLGGSISLLILYVSRLKK